MSGQAADQMYVSESGVKGHEKLDKIMSIVESKASDSSLQGLAKAAHPLVKTHLIVSRQILDKL